MRAIFSLAGLLLATTAATTAHAAVIIVGTCQTGTHLPTIQQAIDASAPGGTVAICPGTYHEQLLITQNLSLKGLANGTSAQVLILPPPGGVAVNTTFLGSTYPIAAQILAQNATINVTGVTVDGTGNGISSCSPDLIGILYQNASGTINNNLVVNQFIAPYASLGGCQSGQGIWAESLNTSKTVSILSNTVQAFQKNALTVTNTGMAAKITGNVLYGLGATTGAAQNGMQISFGATASVTSNHVGDEIWAPDQFGDTGNAAAGILVYDSPGVAITQNSVSSTQFAIAVVSDGTQSANGGTVNNNTIDRVYLYDAVDICGAMESSVSGNHIGGVDEAAIHIDSTCGAASSGGTVSSNVINGACAGILAGPGSTGTYGSQVYNNTATIVLTGTDACQSTLAVRKTATRPHPHPVIHRG